MIAGLNFNIQMIYLSKKGREKGRVWIEIQYNISHLAKRKNAWNQRFSSVLIRIECLLHFCKHNMLAKFWWVFLQLKTVWRVTFVFRSKVQAFTRFFVFKCDIYAHGSSLLLFCCSSFGNLTALVVSFKGYTVRAWVITSSFVKSYSWSCHFVVSAAFVFLRFGSATCRYCHCLFLLLVCEFDSIWWFSSTLTV